MTIFTRRAFAALMASSAFSAMGPAYAQQPATGEPIVIGSSMPLSGPSAVFGLYSQGVDAYFKYVNANGGIDGRPLVLKVYDDAYEPGRTLQNVKRLVESDKVFAVAFVVGTAHNLAIRDYMNEHKVPQVLANTGQAEFGDPEKVAQYPWTTAWLPPYEYEAKTIADYLKANAPEAKVAILRLNDDLGKSLLTGFEKAIEGTGITIVERQVFNQSDASVASPTQVLAYSGADTFLNWSSGTFTPQSVTTMMENGWKPMTFVISWNTSLRTYEPAGLENIVGFLAPAYLKTPTDPAWADDAGVKEYKEAVLTHAPGVDPDQYNVAYGYTEAEIFVKALKAAPELTREALMKSLRNMTITDMTMTLPGVVVETSEEKGDFWPINDLGMRQFDGQSWVDTGFVPVATGE